MPEKVLHFSHFFALIGNTAHVLIQITNVTRERRIAFFSFFVDNLQIFSIHSRIFVA